MTDWKAIKTSLNFLFFSSLTLLSTLVIGTAWSGERTGGLTDWPYSFELLLLGVIHTSVLCWRGWQKTAALLAGILTYSLSTSWVLLGVVIGLTWLWSLLGQHLRAKQPVPAVPQPSPVPTAQPPQPAPAPAQAKPAAKKLHGQALVADFVNHLDTST